MAAPFETTLSPKDERAFQEWKKVVAPQDSGQDYDWRGAFLAGLAPDHQSGHWDDAAFKKSGPPTGVVDEYVAPTRIRNMSQDSYTDAAVAPLDGTGGSGGIAPSGPGQSLLAKLLPQLLPALITGAGAALTSPIKSGPLIAGRAMLGGLEGWQHATPTQKDLYYQERMQREHASWQAAKDYAASLPDPELQHLSLTAPEEYAKLIAAKHYEQMSPEVRTHLKDIFGYDAPSSMPAAAAYKLDADLMSADYAGRQKIKEKQMDYDRAVAVARLKPETLSAKQGRVFDTLSPEDQRRQLMGQTVQREAAATLSGTKASDIALTQPSRIAATESLATQRDAQAALNDGRALTEEHRQSLLDSRAATEAERPALLRAQANLAEGRTLTEDDKRSLLQAKTTTELAQAPLLQARTSLMQDQQLTEADKRLLLEARATTEADRPALLRAQANLADGKTLTEDDKRSLLQAKTTTELARAPLLQAHTSLLHDQQLTESDKRLLLEARAATEAERPDLLRAQANLQEGKTLTEADRGALLRAKTATEGEKPPIVRAQGALLQKKALSEDERTALLTAQVASENEKPALLRAQHSLLDGRELTEADRQALMKAQERLTSSRAEGAQTSNAVMQQALQQGIESLSPEQKAIWDKATGGGTLKGTKEETLLLKPGTLERLDTNEDPSTGESWKVRVDAANNIVAKIGRPPIGKGEIDPGISKHVATAMFKGDQPPEFTQLYRYGAPVRAELEKMGMDVSAAQRQWKEVQRAVATSRGPQQLRLRQAVDFTYESSKKIEELFRDWKRLGGATGYPLLNKGALLATKQVPGELGATATALEAQINDLTGELANVYMGGTAPTDQAMKLAAKNLGADFNEDQFKKAMEVLRFNLGVRHNILEQSAVVPGNRYSAPTPVPTEAAEGAKATHRYNPQTGEIEAVAP